MTIHAAGGPDCELRSAELAQLQRYALRYRAAVDRQDWRLADALADELAAFGTAVSCHRCRKTAHVMADLTSALDGDGVVAIVIPVQRGPDARRN